MDISKNNPNPAIIMGGDFIVGDINWDSYPQKDLNMTIYGEYWFAKHHTTSE